GGGFEHGQGPARIGSGDADDEVPGIVGEDELPGQSAFGFHRPVEQPAHRRIVERTQGEHERTRQQRGDEENEGFSVVAATSTTRRFSTAGSRASCWALEKRWISSR